MIHLRKRWTLEPSCPPTLADEDTKIVIVDPDIARVVEALHSDPTKEPSLSHLRTRLGRKKLARCIEELRRMDVVCEDLGHNDPAQAFWEMMAPAPGGPGLVVSLETLGQEKGTLSGAFGDAGATIGGTGSPLHVVTTPDYLDPALEQRNADAIRSGQPWLLIRPFGTRPWVGPLFLPGITPCWRCLAHKLADGAYSVAWSAALIPASVRVAETMAAVEAVRWLRSGASSTAGCLLELDLRAPSIARHELTFDPRCDVCRPKRRAATSVNAHADVSHLTGVAKNLQVLASESGFVVCGAQLTRAWYLRGDGSLRFRPGESVSGKGMGQEEAIAGCLGEARERSALFLSGRERSVQARMDDIGELAFGPNELLNFSEAQYRARRSWNARHGAFQHIGEPFDTSRAIDWSEIQCLSDGNVRYVPASYIYMGFGDSFCGADSNGCASGSTIEDATLRGLLELIERDAFAIWWYNRIRRPGMDLACVAPARVQLLAEEVLARRGRSLTVLDVTTDLNVPAYVAISADAAGSNILLGSAADLDAENAIWRAVAECTKNVLVNASSEHASHDARRWFRHARLQNLPYLNPNRWLRALRRSNRREGMEITDKLRFCLEACQRSNIPVLAKVMTDPSASSPVVRVIAPGLRHWWARFGPGRLYDVPVKLGWRKRRIAESTLNPFCYFL